MLVALDGGVNGGIVAKAILAQNIINNPHAEAYITSGNVWLIRSSICRSVESMTFDEVV